MTRSWFTRLVVVLALVSAGGGCGDDEERNVETPEEYAPLPKDGPGGLPGGAAVTPPPLPEMPPLPKK